ncbi:MAG: S41 family peptidase, partial [bacterium]
GFMIVLVFTAGALVGSDLSQWTAKKPTSDSLQKELRLFWQAWDALNDNYYKPIDIPSDDIVMGAINGMVGSLNDRFTDFAPPVQSRNMSEQFRGEFGGIGILVDFPEGRMTVQTVFPGTPSEKVGLLPGDVIVAIEGKSVDKMKPLEAVEAIRGQIGTVVNLTIWREGLLEPKAYILMRSSVQIPSVTDSKVLKDHIGYFRMLEFNRNTTEQLEKVLKDFKTRGVTSVIMDLRYNPGGIFDVGVDVADLFLEKGIIVSINSKARKEVHEAHPGDIGESFDVVILVNRYSASASEIVSAALHDNNRAVLVGEKTFGKGVVQIMVPLDNDSAMMIVTGRYFTPKGEDINQKGILPDVTLELDPRKLSSEKAQALFKQMTEASKQIETARTDLLKEMDAEVLDKGVSVLESRMQPEKPA